jgi:hypothetical protein
MQDIAYDSLMDEVSTIYWPGLTKLFCLSCSMPLSDMPLMRPWLLRWQRVVDPRKVSIM